MNSIFAYTVVFWVSVLVEFKDFKLEVSILLRFLQTEFESFAQNGKVRPRKIVDNLC